MTSKYSELREYIYRSNQVTLGIAEILKQIKDGDLFKSEIGYGVDTWHQFLAMPEIGMTVNEANFLIRIYNLSLDFPSLVEVPRRMWKLLDGQDINEELIESAKTLSYQDLKERLYDVTVNDNGERTYTYVVMKRCNETGNLSRVPIIESDEVVERFKDKIENDTN